MRVVRKLAIASLVLATAIPALTACQSSEEREIVAKAKEDFKVLYTYEEDRIRPVIEKKKTPKELAEDYLLTSLGMSEDDFKYSERGVLPSQGIFVTSGIYEGSDIPNIAAISQKEADKANNEKGELYAERKREEFEKLRKEREKYLEQQYAEDNSERDRIESEIKRQVTEMEQDNGKDTSNKK